MQSAAETVEIILLGFNQNHYAICRNFTDENFRVTAASRDKNFLKSSRLPKRYLPSFEDTSPTEFLDQIVALGKQHPKKYFLMPGTDTEVDFLVEHREQLAPYFFISAPDAEKFNVVTDKFLIQEQLIERGFNYPKTILVDENTDFAVASLDIEYPCIVKPAFAGDWKSPISSSVVGEHKVILVNNQNELREHWHKVKEISPRMIAQAIVEPADDDIFSFCSYSDHNGKVLHGFVTQKLIQYPAGFGTALLCQTVDNAEVYELGKQVIEGLGVDGVCETEIIRDARTGELFIIEINTRHWMQHRLSTRLGVNYSLLDFYYRTGNDHKVAEILSNGKGKPNNIIWFDDVGYMIYAVKNIFQPKKCKMKEIFKNQWEYSLFSLVDWRPFFRCVLKKMIN